MTKAWHHPNEGDSLVVHRQLVARFGEVDAVARRDRFLRFFWGTASPIVSLQAGARVGRKRVAENVGSPVHESDGSRASNDEEDARGYKPW